jgi:pyridoxamine 5'-phosphate oxidase
MTTEALDIESLLKEGGIMNKAEILAFCKANNPAWLATLENGEPRVRAMGIYKIEESGIIIQTQKGKDVYDQLYKSPDVELCFYNQKEGTQIRIRGKVTPIEDVTVKAQAIVDRPFLQKFTKGPQDVGLFLLKNGKAHVWNMTTNMQPKTFVQL